MTKHLPYSPGDIVFREGDAGDLAFIIEAGRVEVSIAPHGEKIVLTTLDAGEIFGEMSIIDGSPRSATVTALEEVRLVAVSREAIYDRIEHTDPIVRLLVTMLIKRLRRGNLEQSEGATEHADEAGIVAVAAMGVEPLGDPNYREGVDKMLLEAELKDAIVQDEFDLRFQPIVHLPSGTVAGLEALIRWHSDVRGEVSPEHFMGVAEETSLVVPVGKWVIEKSCEALGVVGRAVGATLPYVSVNVSGQQFRDVYFLHHLSETVARAGVPRDRLKLEITERVLMEGALAGTTIEQARSDGFTFALDDFGTGYSSLQAFCDFPVDDLKIDRTFVSRMTRERAAESVTRSVLLLASGVGASVIAEGVESPEEATALSRLRCEFAQGYHFARPLPLDEAIAYVRKHGVYSASA